MPFSSILIDYMYEMLNTYHNIHDDDIFLVNNANTSCAVLFIQAAHLFQVR